MNAKMIHHLSNDGLLTDLESIFFDDESLRTSNGIEQELSCFSNLNDFELDLNGTNNKACSFYITD